MEVCDEFILVKRDQMELEPEGVELLEQLQPFLKKVIKDDYWPGTRLMGHYADVYFLIVHLKRSIFFYPIPPACTRGYRPGCLMIFVF